MKAILEILEKEIKFELENYPIGEPIILITSNMSPDLKEQIEEIIGRYCNH